MVGATGSGSQIRRPANTFRNNSQQESKDASALAGGTLIANVIFPLPHDIYSTYFATTKLLATSAGKDNVSRSEPTNKRKWFEAPLVPSLAAADEIHHPMGSGKWFLPFLLLGCGRAAFILCMCRQAAGARAMKPPLSRTGNTRSWGKTPALLPLCSLRIGSPSPSENEGHSYVNLCTVGRAH